MYISYIFIIATLALVSSSSSGLAVTNSTSNVGTSLESQIKELITNPYFAPDASCDFDAYQLICIPGDNQDCYDIPGFAQNEDGTCHVTGDCPDRYHSATDDETGQCYPDTEPCWPGQVRNQTDPNDKGCDDEKINKTKPDATCLTSPDHEKCDTFKEKGALQACPDGFAVMSSVNLTSSKCVPEDVEEQEKAERERKVYDEDRCHPDYELYVPDGVDIYRMGADKPIGTCNPIN